MAVVAEPWDVVVVGAGAAGLVAAERAASRGLRTLLLEKNRRPGVKILMSGGTRCNLTHDCDERGIVAAFGDQGKFLHSALAALGTKALIALVEAEGVATKIEDTGKVFPVSDRAVDVLNAFLARLDRSPCQVAYEEPLVDLLPQEDGFQLQTSRRTLGARTVIVTTGGKSYPGCGTSGDAYAWAARLGHRIVPPRPALTPVTTGEAWVQALRGITIPDVRLQLEQRETPPAEASSATARPRTRVKGKPPGWLDERRGSLLFTHFGLSGPVALDISAAVTAQPAGTKLLLECDFLPEVSESTLEQQLRGPAQPGKRTVASILPESLPRRLGEALLGRMEVAPETRLAEFSREGRQRLLTMLKRCPISVAGTRGFDKAEVTAGGVPLAEVDSRTMQSKLVPGLYWAGEVLDLDGPIGGYNFQAAFSTGWLAGLRCEPRSMT